MTLLPEEITPKSSLNVPAMFGSLGPLEDLFYVGYTQSDRICVYDDPDKKIKIDVIFRTLTPIELRDVFESINRFETVYARDIAMKLEVLSRSITTINDMPLILTENERTEYFNMHKVNPSPLEMAKIILSTKLKSPYLLDLLYNSYSEFTDQIHEQFENIKKKLKPQKSST